MSGNEERPAADAGVERPAADAGVVERLERALAQAQQRLAKADARIDDQCARLDALGAGREETMRLLGETRAELERVAADRDRLRKRLTSVESMQTETIAFADDEEEEPGIHPTLPSIEELMASLNLMADDHAARGRVRLSGQAAELPDADWQEMIPPEAIASHEDDEDDEPRPNRTKSDPSRLLVYIAGERAVKYPLDKDVMTIGRSEEADIQLEGQVVSRVHAIVISTRAATTIEDAGSKNGFKINAKDVDRHTLRHGDIIEIGKHSLTFLEVGGAGRP